MARTQVPAGAHELAVDESTSAPGLYDITSPSGFTPTAIGMLKRPQKITFAEIALPACVGVANLVSLRWGLLFE